MKSGKRCSVGQEIPVFVIAPEDPNGNVVLSYVRAREESDWTEVEALLVSGRRLREQGHWIQQGRVDRPDWRLARVCACFSNQPYSPTWRGRNTRTALWEDGW